MEWECLSITLFSLLELLTQSNEMSLSRMRPWPEIKACGISFTFLWGAHCILRFQTSTCGWAVAGSPWDPDALSHCLKCLFPPRGTWPVVLDAVVGYVGRRSPMAMATVCEVKRRQPRGSIWEETHINSRDIIPLTPTYHQAPDRADTRKYEKMVYKNGGTKWLLEDLKQKVEGKAWETPEVERMG